MREWSGSNPERHKPGSGAGLILLVLAGAVGVTYLASGALRGSVAVLLWGEQEMLTCDGGLKMTLQGRTVEMTDPVLDVGGLCELRVVDCTLKSDSAAIQVGGNARVLIENSRLVGKRAALFVRGNAEVMLLNTELSGGREGIDAGNSARVEMRGGWVRGDEAAVAARNAAEVKGVGAEAIGPLRTEQQGRAVDFVQEQPPSSALPPEGGGGEAAAAADDTAAADAPAPEPAGEPAGEGVAGPPLTDEQAADLLEQARRLAEVGMREEVGERAAEGAEAGPAVPVAESAEEKYQRYAGGACSGILTCYQEADYVGHLAGTVEMTVDAQGRVVKVRPRLKGAPKRIRGCVKQVARRKRIDGFDGPAGTLICKFAGTLGGGSVMISRSGEFVPGKARKRGRGSRRPR